MYLDIELDKTPTSLVITENRLYCPEVPELCCLPAGFLAMALSMSDLSCCQRAFSWFLSPGLAWPGLIWLTEVELPSSLCLRVALGLL